MAHRKPFCTYYFPHLNMPIIIFSNTVAYNYIHYKFLFFNIFTPVILARSRGSLLDVVAINSVILLSAVSQVLDRHILYGELFLDQLPDGVSKRETVFHDTMTIEKNSNGQCVPLTCTVRRSCEERLCFWRDYGDRSAILIWHGSRIWKGNHSPLLDLNPDLHLNRDPQPVR